MGDGLVLFVADVCVYGVLIMLIILMATVVRNRILNVNAVFFNLLLLICMPVLP